MAAHVVPSSTKRMKIIQTDAHVRVMGNQLMPGWREILQCTDIHPIPKNLKYYSPEQFFK